MIRFLAYLLIAASGAFAVCAEVGEEETPLAKPVNHRPFWIRADYLQWWAQGAKTPPLVTTSPAGTPRTSAGVLGAPGTSTLFGDQRLGDGGRSGWRIQMGYRLDACGCGGLEASYFRLADKSDGFAATGASTPILAVPFFGALSGLAASNPISLPGTLFGRIDIEFDSEIQGAEFLITEDIHASPGVRLELLSGYRHFGLDETLGIVERSTVLSDPLGMVPTGTVFEIVDRFEVDNEFHGGQVGLRGSVAGDVWSLSVLGKIALGVNHQVVTINGRQRVDVAGAFRVDSPFGTLTQGSNIGRHSQHKFAVIPELSIDLACRLTDNVRLSAGYTLIYFTRTVRPGDQIDLLIDPTQTVAQPSFSFEGSGLLVQGLHASLIVNY